MALADEADELDAQLKALTAPVAPELLALKGVGADVAAQLLATAGDNPDRLHSEAAFAHLCGVAPIPASSGRRDRHQLNRGGDRAANHAPHSIVLYRIRWDERTHAYVERRTTEGLAKKNIMRCLKRHVAHEVYRVTAQTNRTPDTNRQTTCSEEHSERGRRRTSRRWYVRSRAPGGRLGADQEAHVLEPETVTRNGPPPGKQSGQRRAWLALGTVALGFVLVQLVVVVPGSGLGWDETVYVSQVSSHVPAAFFSAPRARGVSVLVAPVAWLTTSTPALRVYLALLSGGALFGSLWVWRPLLPLRVLTLAGVLFGGLWVTLFYGPAAMPNLWVAFAAMTAVGCFLRLAGGEASRWLPVRIAGAVAVASLMRPLDAVWLAAPLVVAALVVPGWRRPVLVLAVLGGLAIGGAQWIVEAEVRFGGIGPRLRQGSDIQGGLGWHPAILDQLRALDGHTLCRPCTVPWRHRPATLWFLLLPLAAVAGLLASRQARRLRASMLAVAVAACMAAPYLFTVGYAAPRFLLPTYLLLTPVTADALLWPLRVVRPGVRPVVLAALGLALVGHLALQQSVLARTVARTNEMTADWQRIAAQLHRLGVRPPCILTGVPVVPIAYDAGCASRTTSGADASITPAQLLAVSRTQPVALITTAGTAPPAFAGTWRTLPLTGLHQLKGWQVHLAPGGGR